MGLVAPYFTFSLRYFPSIFDISSIPLWAGWYIRTNHQRPAIYRYL